MALTNRIPQIMVEMQARMDAAEMLAAKAIETEAKMRAPVGAPDEHLRDAIHVESHEDGTYVVAGNEDIYYGHIVEHGSAGDRGQAPQPFMAPAMDAAYPVIIAETAAVLRSL